MTASFEIKFKEELLKLWGGMPIQGEMVSITNITMLLPGGTTTIKLPILNNASAKSNGATLNDCLHAGLHPPLKQGIFDTMLS